MATYVPAAKSWEDDLVPTPNALACPHCTCARTHGGLYISVYKLSSAFVTDQSPGFPASFARLLHEFLQFTLNLSRRWMVIEVNLTCLHCWVLALSVANFIFPALRGNRREKKDRGKEFLKKNQKAVFVAIPSCLCSSLSLLVPSAPSHFHINQSSCTISLHLSVSPPLSSTHIHVLKPDHDHTHTLAHARILCLLSL